MVAVDKKSPIPAYYQLAGELRQAIQKAHEGGETFDLPSENELSENHHISRATVRQALALLEQEGLIYREKGRGTFVAKKRARHELTSLIPFTDDMKRRGLRPETRFLQSNEIEGPAEMTEALDLPPGSRLFEISRTRLGNGEPLSLQWSYLPEKLFRGLLTHDLRGSLSAILETQYGMRYHTAQETIRARLATSEECAHLNLRIGDPVLYMERVSYSPNGTPMEFLKSVWRADRYDFVVRLTRPAS